MQTVPFIFLLFIPIALVAQNDGALPLTVVPEIDINRYMGVWYEVARLPNSFQSHCAGDITATYSLMDDGRIKVVNRCRKEDGSMSVAEGVAKRASDDGPMTKLKVRFAPAILSWLPFVWGDYWIIDLSPDYRYAVIGEPARKYFWILSRMPTMGEPTIEGILARAREKGYDLTNLIRTKNSGN